MGCFGAILTKQPFMRCTMHFDMRKFIATGTKPYQAEFPCDFSTEDFAGARIREPVTAFLRLRPMATRCRMTIAGKSIGARMRTLPYTHSPGKRQLKRSGPSRSGIWMTRISSYRWMKKASWMWMNGSVPGIHFPNSAVLLMQPRLPGLMSQLRQKEGGRM